MLTFDYIWMFALLPLPLILRWVSPAYREVRPAVRIPMFSRLAEVAGRKPGAGAASRQRSWVQSLLFITAWCAVVAALARPQWLEPPVVQVVPTRDLMLAVDLSGSMEVEDFVSASGEKVDRLTAVKYVLDEFLARREGDRVGLIVFGTNAYVQAPFTQDLDVCRELLQDTAPRMAGPRTAFGDAIGLAITLFERSEVENRVLIALTDGNDTGSRVPPAEAARIAADQGIIIHTVAIGDPSTAGEEALDEEALKAVASETGGKYFFAADREELEGIYDELDRLDTREVESVSYRPKQDLYHWPLALFLVLTLSYHSVMAVRAGRKQHVHEGKEHTLEEVA